VTEKPGTAAASLDSRSNNVGVGGPSHTFVEKSRSSATAMSTPKSAPGVGQRRVTSQSPVVKCRSSLRPGLSERHGPGATAPAPPAPPCCAGRTTWHSPGQEERPQASLFEVPVALARMVRARLATSGLSSPLNRSEVATVLDESSWSLDFVGTDPGLRSSVPP